MLGGARHERRRRSNESQSGEQHSDPPAEPGSQVPEPMSSHSLDEGVSSAFRIDGSEAGLGSPAYTGEAPSEAESEFTQSADAEVASVQEERTELPAQTSPPAADTTEGRLAEPVKVQLDRLATQIHGLQEQLDAFIARRNEAVAERASHHVASIVAAAERSAAQITAGAETDAAATRERLLADVQAEADGIRSEAQAGAARIRTEAHSQAARARDQAIREASEEIQVVCARLSEELQAGAQAAIAEIAGGTGAAAPAEAPVQAEAEAPAPARQITDEVQDAVQELQNAATLLEQSLRDLRAIGDEQEPV